MFERFTERARQVVVLAQEDARKREHNWIGTEHILMGLIREEAGLAARVLESFDIYEHKYDEWLTVNVPNGEEKTDGQIPMTPRGKLVLESALREALSLGHNYIGTEHILLGLVREGGGSARDYLLANDLDSEKIRNEVIRMLNGPGARREAVDALPIIIWEDVVVTRVWGDDATQGVEFTFDDTKNAKQQGRFKFGDRVRITVELIDAD